MNGQCSCGYRPGRISPIDCRCVTHKELNERLKKIDPEEGYIQKEIDELKATKQDKLIAGTNITIEGSMISADLDSTNFYNKTETDELLAEKQDTLTAGENIAISEDNVISADAHMLVTLTPTGAPVGGVTDYTWTSEYTYAELVASLDKVAFKTTEAGSENILVPTELYEALEDSQNVIFGMIPSNDPSVPKITNLELIVRPDGTAKSTESNSLLQPKLTAGTNITIRKDDNTGETIISATGGGGDSYGVTITPGAQPNITWTAGVSFQELKDNLDKITVYMPATGGEPAFGYKPSFAVVEPNPSLGEVIYMEMNRAAMTAPYESVQTRMFSAAFILANNGSGITRSMSDNLQSRLTAGQNITIDANNVISATSLTKADLLTLLGVEEINVNIEDDQGNPRTATVLGIFTS